MAGLEYHGWGWRIIISCWAVGIMAGLRILWELCCILVEGEGMADLSAEYAGVMLASPSPFSSIAPEALKTRVVQLAIDLGAK
jgi:hypothetical protein